MISIKTAFGCAASGDSGFSTFWLLVFAIVILDDAQRREEKRRKKRERDARPPHRPKPPAGPCP